MKKGFSIYCLLKHLHVLRVVWFGLLVLGFTLSLYADTTWVSGQVSGVWTESGSPYMIIDSTWVNATDTLRVTGGVEVVLPYTNSLLRLGGVFKAEGSQQDSVYIALLDSNCRVNGPVTGSARRVEFNFASLTGVGRWDVTADSAILYSTSLQIVNASFNPKFTSAGVVLRNCDLLDLKPVNARVQLSNTHVKEWLYLDGGGLWADSLTSEGTISSFIPGLGWYVTNSVVQNMYINMYGGASQITAISESWIKNLSVELCLTTTLSNCRIDTLDIEDCGGSVRNCIFDRVHLYFEAPAIYPSLLMRNNTFVEHECCLGWEPRAFIYYNNDFSARRQLTLTNNIFYSHRSEIQALESIFLSAYDVLQSPPSYNIVHGMADPWGGRTLGAGNQNVDPQFDPNSEWCDLLPSSPAINNGNPSYNDADGTVSDIGARWWDHRYDHPPIITVPRQIDTRWGDSLKIWIHAVDDHQAAIIPPPGIPYWFNTSRVSDFNFSVLVPFGVRSVVLPVTAIDNLNQTDQDTIRIEIHPRSDLPDTIKGTLTAEYSPYTFDHDVVVMPGDTLVIEPGVRVRALPTSLGASLIVHGFLDIQGTAADSVWFESDPGTYWWGILVIDSTAGLHASYCNIGTTGYIPFHLEGCGRCEIEHCKIETNPDQWDGILAWDMTDSLIAEHLDIMGESFISGSSFQIASCNFYSGYGDYGTSLSIKRSNGTIRACRFLADNLGGLAAGGGSDVLVEGCLFQTLGEYPTVVSSSSDHLIGRFMFYNNTLISHYDYLFGSGLGTSYDTVYNEVFNNLFIGADSFAFYFNEYPNRLGIHMANNCFWANGTPARDPRGFLPGLGELVMVNLNGDSTDAYGNIFLDPLFADTVDYCLSALSPCIDAGLDVGFPFFGNAPDIGWWEFGTPDNIFKPPQTTLLPDYTLAVFPNPFNSITQIEFMLPTTQRVSLRLYDVLGREVAVLVNEIKTAGEHRVAFDASTMASGVYLCRMEAGSFAQTRKIVLLR
jgi:hypothetical protein